MLKNKSYNIGLSRFFYKLLHDTLFIFMLFFVLAMFAEGALPGIISNHLKLFYVAIIILANIALINVFAWTADIKLSKKHSKKTAVAAALPILILLFNGMLHVNIFLNLFILIFTLIILAYSYKILFLEDQEG